MPYGTITVNWPAMLKVMTPAQLHVHMLELLRAGFPPTNTVGLPGAHGAAVTGTQGMGVSTPNAAAVAEATVGLAMLMQTPKVGILTMGLLSMMLAAGMLQPMVSAVGNTIKAPGAAPKEQLINAPLTTN